MEVLRLKGPVHSLKDCTLFVFALNWVSTSHGRKTPSIPMAHWTRGAGGVVTQCNQRFIPLLLLVINQSR